MTQKFNQKASIILLVSCGIFLLLAFIRPRSSWSPSSHELWGMFFSIFLYVIPAEIVLKIILSIKCRLNGEKTKKSICLNLSCLLALALCAGAFTFLSNECSTSGVIKDFELQTVNGQRYVVSDNKMIKVTEEQASHIGDPSQWYTYEYHYNNLIPNEYTMEYIEANLQQ